MARGQNASKQAIEISASEYWRDFELMQELPAGLRHWLEFEANDTYQVGPILEAYWVRMLSYAEIERHLRKFSRQQYESDYEWTGENPPRKGKTNELQMSGVQDERRVQVHDVSMGRVPRRQRHRTSIASGRVDNDADYHEW